MRPRTRHHAFPKIRRIIPFLLEAERGRRQHSPLGRSLGGAGSIGAQEDRPTPLPCWPHNENLTPGTKPCKMWLTTYKESVRIVDDQSLSSVRRFPWSSCAHSCTIYMYTYHGGNRNSLLDAGDSCVLCVRKPIGVQPCCQTYSRFSLEISSSSSSIIPSYTSQHSSPTRAISIALSSCTFSKSMRILHETCAE